MSRRWEGGRSVLGDMCEWGGGSWASEGLGEGARGSRAEDSYFGRWRAGSGGKGRELESWHGTGKKLLPGSVINGRWCLRGNLWLMVLSSSWFPSPLCPCPKQTFILLSQHHVPITGTTLPCPSPTPNPQGRTPLGCAW